MRPPGSYKFVNRGRPFESPQLRNALRAQRIVESLRSEILAAGEDPYLRIRRIFSGSREIFRLELELPELNYQRTTLLDHDALEALLEADDIGALVSGRVSFS